MTMLMSILILLVRNVIAFMLSYFIPVFLGAFIGVKYIILQFVRWRQNRYDPKDDFMEFAQ